MASRRTLGTTPHQRVFMRRMWGVTLRSASDDTPLVLWRGWHGSATVAYPGEPNRPLVFGRRGDARAWCRAQHAKYRGRHDCCGAWRFRPVRMQERYSADGGR